MQCQKGKENSHISFLLMQSALEVNRKYDDRWDAYLCYYFFLSSFQQLQFGTNKDTSPEQILPKNIVCGANRKSYMLPLPLSNGKRNIAYFRAAHRIVNDQKEYKNGILTRIIKYSLQIGRIERRTVCQLGQMFCFHQTLLQIQLQTIIIIRSGVS